MRVISIEVIAIRSWRLFGQTGVVQGLVDHGNRCASRSRHGRSDGRSRSELHRRWCRRDFRQPPNWPLSFGRRPRPRVGRNPPGSRGPWRVSRAHQLREPVEEITTRFDLAHAVDREFEARFQRCSDALRHFGWIQGFIGASTRRRATMTAPTAAGVMLPAASEESPAHDPPESTDITKTHTTISLAFIGASPGGGGDRRAVRTSTATRVRERQDAIGGVCVACPMSSRSGAATRK